MVKCWILQRGYNMNLIDKILVEWAYRVDNGMPNPKNPLHLVHLEETLNELKLPRKVSEKLLQNLRQIKEIDIVKNKESGNVYDVQNHNPDTQDLVKKDASEKDIEKVKKGDDEEKAKPEKEKNNFKELRKVKISSNDIKESKSYLKPAQPPPSNAILMPLELCLSTFSIALTNASSVNSIN